MFISRYLISILFIATLASCGGGSGSSNNEGLVSSDNKVSNTSNNEESYSSNNDDSDSSNNGDTDSISSDDLVSSNNDDLVSSNNDDSYSTSTDDSDSTINESADGYWVGFVTDSDGTSSEVEFLSSGGKFVVIDEDDDIVVSGSLNIRGDKLASKDTKLYEYDDIYLMDLEVDGFVTTKSRILADIIDVESVEKSSLSLDYDILLDEPITYSDLSGSWDILDDNDEFYPVDIDSRGAFNFDVDGCIVSGKFSIPNNTLSIFSVEYSVSGENTCIVGDYSGLGALVEDELVAIGTNSEYATILTAVKSNR